MGLLGFFLKKKGVSTFGVFPDLKQYRLFLFLKGGSIEELQARLDEYSELYPEEIVFSAKLHKLSDTPWTYIVLTPLPKAATEQLVWHYLNQLLWMSDKAEKSFAYAYSKQKGGLPVFAERDWANQFGDSCKGMANGRYFYAAIPEQQATWELKVPGKFDYEKYLMEQYGVDIRHVNKNLG